MKKHTEEAIETPIASMIDVVFLLIIFFVVTAAVEKDVIDESIQLAQARYVKPVKKKDPRTVTINVRANGAVNIALQPMTLSQLEAILRATFARHGNMIPVLIRSDGETLFNEIDRVMQSVGKAGLYRVKLAAVSTQ